MLDVKKIVLLSMSIWMCDVIAIGPAFMYEAEGVSISSSGVSCRMTGDVIGRIGFDAQELWRVENYSNRLCIEVGKSFLGRQCLYVEGMTNNRDTAWCVWTPEFSVQRGLSRCMIEMRVFSGKMLSASMQGLIDAADEKWQNAVCWYDDYGNEMGMFPFRYFTSGENRFADVTSVLDIPAGAVKGKLRFGFDYPNLGNGEIVAISDITVIDIGNRHVPKASFVSEMRKGGRVAWNASTPDGTEVKFQWRGAKNPKDLLSAQFRGPDGSTNAFYTSTFDADMPYIQYKAVLVANGMLSPVLESVSVEKRIDQDWLHMIDDEPPEIWRAMESPTENRTPHLAFSIQDNSFVDWDSVKIGVDGEDATSRFEREGDIIKERKPSIIPYSNGIHKVVISASDCRGNSVVSDKIFYIGDVPNVPKCSLRDDGMMLVDGNPFFPIGIYAVCEREFNDFSLDKAFLDLKNAGFNFVQTYGKTYEKNFIPLAEKHGLKLWVGWRNADDKFMERGRRQKNILAWYLGDDTSEHAIPQVVRDRHDNVTAVDPMRLTCQADVVSPHWQVSRYARYVTATDVFMPEIYPIRGKSGHPSDITCVADTVYEMKRVKQDMARFGNGKVRGCWPILQWFKGWSEWHHFPSRDQLFATSFAAIIHGANGITWYTYGGFYNKRHKRWDEGVTSSPERWNAICELTDWLRELSPVLLARPCCQPGAPEIISGPKTDSLGQISVSAILKRHNGKAYLIAVNAAHEPVRARFRLNNMDALAVVHREGRSVDCIEGVVEDDFPPFGVHVYCLIERN